MALIRSSAVINSSSQRPGSKDDPAAVCVFQPALDAREPRIRRAPGYGITPGLKAALMLTKTERRQARSRSLRSVKELVSKARKRRPAPAAPTPAAANPCARAAIGRETGPGSGRSVRPPIVDGRDLDILVIPPPIGLLVFDAQVREMDLVIEVREVVFVRPFLDLVRVAIGPTIAVVTVPITLVEPLLVLTLELVVEGHPIDACPALREAFGFSEVRAVHQGTVFHFARLLQTR